MWWQLVIDYPHKTSDSCSSQKLHLVWVFSVIVCLFIDNSLERSEQILSRMMDEFIHWPKPCLLLSTTCDGILSWMFEVWMMNHLVTDNVCNTINL